MCVAFLLLVCGTVQSEDFTTSTSDLRQEQVGRGSSRTPWRSTPARSGAARQIAVRLHHSLTLWSAAHRVPSTRPAPTRLPTDQPKDPPPEPNLAKRVKDRGERYASPESGQFALGIDNDNVRNSNPCSITVCMSTDVLRTPRRLDMALCAEPGGGDLEA